MKQITQLFLIFVLSIFLQGCYPTTLEQQSKDIKAAQLLLEYTLVKPKQEFDITTDGQSFNIKELFKIDTDKDTE